MTDLRTMQDRDAAVLSQIQRNDGFSIHWACSNRDVAASIHRLIAGGHLEIEGSGWIRIEKPSRPWRQVLREWALGVASA